jgi:HEPN domain-containing protein
MGPKALEIFVVAEQFYWAGALAARIPHEVAAGNPQFQFGRDLPVMPSAAVACFAISLELYLKCLIRMGNKPAETGHDLVKLFKKVGVRNRAAIKRYFRQNIEETRKYLERAYSSSGRPVPNPNFDFALSASKDASLTCVIYMRREFQPTPVG